MESVKKGFLPRTLIVSLVLCIGLAACGSDGVTISADDSSRTTGSDSATKDDPQSGNAGVDEKTAGSSYTCSYNDVVHIPSTVNGETISISANIFIPDEKKKGELFPAIVFINSWSCNEYEYMVQAEKFAHKGYVVLSYECRGWFKSGGKIAMGTEIDWIDFSHILDWLLENAPVDSENLGVAGISLGGGGSLHAISRDPRVKTAAAMSSYTDAWLSMYSESTPRLVWGSLLAVTGATMGNLDQWIWDLYTDTMTNTNIDWVEQKAATQSPITFVGLLNKLNKPVYLSHNFGDYMFMPNTTLAYYNALAVDHKRLDLCQGTHATAEMPGAAGLPNYTFNNVHRWFDYWLKGIDTGIIPDKEKSAVVTMQVKGTSERVVYNDLGQWPPEDQHVRLFYCHAGAGNKEGILSREENKTDRICTIISGPVSGAASGVPIITPLFEGFNVLFTIPLGKISPMKAVIYRTGVMDQALCLRGIATINLRIAMSGRKGQVFAYLYDVDESDNATFITHSFKTWWDAAPGNVMNVPLEFVANAYDLAPGHRLALVVDTYDSSYGSPTLSPYEVSLVHDGTTQMVLRIPVE